MSQWTHVSAVIRIDDLRLPGSPSMAPKLGNTCQFDSDPAAWDACDVPCGSEGSLQHQLWTSPDECQVAAHTAMIWGDLRDYDDVGEILDYLNRVIENCWVRQGAAHIDVEGREPVVLKVDGAFENPRWKIVSGAWFSEQYRKAKEQAND